jgi:hypothetical protein
MRSNAAYTANLNHPNYAVWPDASYVSSKESSPAVYAAGFSGNQRVRTAEQAGTSPDMRVHFSSAWGDYRACGGKGPCL